MLYLGSFFNNIVNQLIRNLNMSVRITISLLFLFLAIYSFYRFLKSYNDATKDLKSANYKKLKLGWIFLTAISITISILYIVL